MGKKKYAVWFCCLGALLAASTGWAQAVSRLTLSLEIPALTYVVGENVPAKIRVTNNSAETVSFNEPGSPEKLGIVVKRPGSMHELPMIEGKEVFDRGVTLKSGEQFFTDISIDDLIDIRKPGSYQISFSLISGSEYYVTAPRQIQVVPGQVLKKTTQMFADRPNQQRVFTVVKWSRDNIQWAFLRVEDYPDTGIRHKTVNLGSYIDLVPPRVTISAKGEVTVLHRASAEFFFRHLFWSVPSQVVLRERSRLLDPATATSERFNLLQDDVSTVLKEADKDKDRRRR